MSVLRNIIECDIAYLKCFCEADEQKDFIRFQDKLMPDMYYHNYTWIKSVENDFALIQLIESEIAHSKAMGRGFCLIRCHAPMNKSMLARLSHAPEISVSGYYVFDISRLSGLSKREDCAIRRVDKAEMLEDILALDLEHDEESCGRDFCTRRVYRRKDIYLSNEGVDSYLCYHGGKAIGNCDLFIHNGAAKIEDFAVSPQAQGQGFGTAILKSLIEIALDKNASVVYLETDEEGTAKEMYQKRGLKKINDFTDIIFRF